jgi:UDP-N-acetylglucosamine acyltransferase
LTVGKTNIHPSAVIAPGAELTADVTVGPYAIIGERVRIGARTLVGPHVVLDGRTTIGSDNRFFPFASVGTPPQDLKYRGENSELIIGADNTFREFCTLNPGTEGGGMISRIGNGNLLMNYTHVAHDCHLGDHNVLANGVQLGGHVEIGDYAILGALSGVHQFVRIGESAIIGAGSMVSLDVAPFCNATGDRARLLGLNSVGLKRRGFSVEVQAALKRAYRLMFQSGLKLTDASQRVREEVPEVPEVERFLAFIEQSERGLCR